MNSTYPLSILPKKEVIGQNIRYELSNYGPPVPSIFRRWVCSVG